jgi:hypothetical protein
MISMQGGGQSVRLLLVLVGASLTDKSLYSAAIFDRFVREACQPALAQRVDDERAYAPSIAPWCSPA